MRMYGIDCSWAYRWKSYFHINLFELKLDAFHKFWLWTEESNMIKPVIALV